jgi:hypothetical protein
LSGIDWRLIAAIGYQESHWDAAATSPTGVRGLMMLTDETAERLQVKNRLDARDSIIGGARYFALLKEALNPRIAEPDKTYLALAAYNLGLGHLEDARIVAQQHKLNPDKWQDVRQVLGKLAEPETFNTLKHGYARGFEALQLVDNVRNYHDILVRMEPREPPAPARRPSVVLEGDRARQVIGVGPGLDREGAAVVREGVVRRVGDRDRMRRLEADVVDVAVERGEHAAMGHDDDRLAGVLAHHRLERLRDALVELAPALPAGNRVVGIHLAHA